MITTKVQAVRIILLPPSIEDGIKMTPLRLPKFEAASRKFDKEFFLMIYGSKNLGV